MRAKPIISESILFYDLAIEKISHFVKGYLNGKR